MADDIVTRLRQYECKCSPPDGVDICTACEAADEIERLYAEINNLRMHLVALLFPKETRRD